MNKENIMYGWGCMNERRIKLFGGLNSQIDIEVYTICENVGYRCRSGIMYESGDGYGDGDGDGDSKMIRVEWCVR